MPEKYVTKEGLVKLEKKIDFLKNVRRKEIKNRIEEATKMGDLSENAEYHEAKDDQGMNEGKIRELDDIIKNAVIIEEKGDKSTINVGSTIKTEFNGQEKEFTIVGPSEADPMAGFISNESPLGAAFIGQKVGDTIEVEAPAGMIRYKIKSIE